MKWNYKNITIMIQWPIRVIRRNPGRDPRRGFTHTQQVQVWHEQSGVCGNDVAPGCGEPLDLRTVIFHHIQPWYKGGKTIIWNCVALCPNCHQEKTFEDVLGNAERGRNAPGDEIAS